MQRKYNVLQYSQPRPHFSVSRLVSWMWCFLLRPSLNYWLWSTFCTVWYYTSMQFLKFLLHSFHVCIWLWEWLLYLRQQFKCSLDNAKRSFFPSINALFSKLGRLASEDVFLHLVNSKCMPILLYSLEVCPLNKADIRSLDFTVTRFFVKSFRTSNTHVIKGCCTYFKFKLPSELIAGKFEIFLANCSAILG